MLPVIVVWPTAISIVPSFLIETFSVEAFSVLTTETVPLFSTSTVPVVSEGITIVFTVAPFAIWTFPCFTVTEPVTSQY